MLPFADTSRAPTLRHSSEWENTAFVGHRPSGCKVMPTPGGAAIFSASGFAECALAAQDAGLSGSFQSVVTRHPSTFKAPAPWRRRLYARVPTRGLRARIQCSELGFRLVPQPSQARASGEPPRLRVSSTGSLLATPTA